MHETVTTILLCLVALLILRALMWRVVCINTRALRALLARVWPSKAADRVQPLRAKFLSKFPGTSAFVQARLRHDAFTGLPLTLFVIAALYVVSLLSGIVEELFEADEMIALDRRINLALADYRTTLGVELFAWITDLGGANTLLAVVVVATGFFLAQQQSHMVMPLWLSVLGAILTTWAGKFSFDRARPEFLTMVTEASPSFPSGHATGAMAVYGFVAYAIARDLSSRRQRFEAVFWSAVLIALVGFSRIFLSVHYASDVAAGFLVGGFWLLIGFSLAEYRRAST